MPKHLKIKTKPEVPIRIKSVSRSIDFDLCITLEYFLDKIKDVPGTAIIKTNHDVYYDGCSGADTLSLTWFSSETDEEFALREATYLKELEAYNTWYKANEVQIKEQLLRKEEKERKSKLRALKQAEATIKEKQKQLAMLKKELGEE